MSVPEVERVLGRSLTDGGMDKALADQAQEWILEALPLPLHKPNERYSLPVTLYEVPAHAIFHFDQRKLGRVEVQFQPTTSEKTTELARQIREELAKEYRPADDLPRPQSYRKEAVEAVLTSTPLDSQRFGLRVVLQYLPFVSEAPQPVVVQSNVF